MSTLTQSPLHNDKEKLLADAVTALPSEMYQISTHRAVKALFMSIFLCTIGYILLAILPWYCLPILWLFLGACYSGLLSVSHECSRGSFSRFPIVNYIVGNIVSAPLLLPYESFKLQTNHKILDKTYNVVATSKWTWWLSSTIASIRANFVLNAIFKKGNRRRVVFSMVCLYLFISIFFPVMFNYLGFWGLCKFYLIPYILYHFWMSTFISWAYRIPFMEDTSLRVSISFPAASKLPQWLNFLTNDINYVISMTRYFSSSLTIPNHNIPKSFDILKENFSKKLDDINQIKEEQLEKLSEVNRATQQKFRGVNWIPALWILLTPIIAIYGMFTTPLLWQTAVLFWVGYLTAGLGITVGYHRMFSHRSFEPTTKFAKFLILMCGTSAFEGSALWWSKDHRAHHRYVDTDKDPYDISKGFFWAHMGWLLVKQDKAKVGKADVVDLENDAMLKWQDRFYLPLAFTTGILIPILVAGLGWGDWRGGFFYAVITRSVFVLQSTFCVNSLAHYVGSFTYTDEHTPRDCWFVSLVTFGEGYHNFHHEFPYDYRNGVKFYSYDPSKWTIWIFEKLGLVKNLKRFPANEIKKGELQMMEKLIEREKSKLNWGKTKDQLPKYTMGEVVNRTKEGASLIVVDGFVHDVSQFVPEHPGGVALIKSFLGKDASNAFNGGIYNHSNGAKNLLTEFRVGSLVDEDKKTL